MGQYLVKLRTRVRCLVFFDSQCIVRASVMPMLLCVTTNVPASVLDQLRRFNTNLKISNIIMTKKLHTFAFHR